MSDFLNKWANWKTAEKSLKLEGSQSESEQKALKPMSIGSAAKGKLPAESAVKMVDTTPHIQPRIPNQPVAVTNQSKVPAQSQSGDASTFTSPADYAKMAEVQNLMNFFKFIESGVASRSLINVNPRDINH
jgi:hypothetical protein